MRAAPRDAAVCADGVAKKDPYSNSAPRAESKKADLMRKFNPKGDQSKKNYYKDRFFVPEETPKSSANESDFKDDLDALEGIQILNSYVEFNTLVLYVEPAQN